MIKKLFYLSNLAFLALYVILAWHNRLTLDDFHFMTNVHRYGVVQGTIAEYNFYSTRWLSVLVVHSVLYLMPFMNALFLFGIVTIAAIVLSFTYLLKNLLQVFYNYKPDTVLLVNMGIFTVNAFFYSCMDIGNIWFWLSAMPTYLGSFIFFSLGCGIILSGKKLPVAKFALSGLSFFYIGGSAETFAAVILLAIAGTVLWLQFFKPGQAGRKLYITRLVTAFLFCLGSLIVLYLGHGNVVRRGLTGAISIPKAFILNIETTGWIGLHWISRTVPFVLLFSLPLEYAGKYFSLKNKVASRSLSETGKVIGKAIILYGALIYIFNFPITYLLCGIAPGRALAPVSFLTWALFAFMFFQLGYRANIQEKLAGIVIGTALGLCLMLNVYNAINQFIITREYAMKYDALMAELISKKDAGSTVRVIPLPPSGMLTPLDISHDSLTNNNMFIKNALGLKGDIMQVK